MLKNWNSCLFNETNQVELYQYLSGLIAHSVLYEWNTLSPTKAHPLPPVFHALTRSDNSSFFSGKSKKSPYGKWSTLPDLTNALCHLIERPLTRRLAVLCVLPSVGCQPSTQTYILSVTSHVRVPSTNQGRPDRTCQDSDQPSWILVGTIYYCRA